MRIILKHSGGKRIRTTDEDDGSNPPSSPPPSQTPYKPRQLEFKLRQAHNPPPPSRPPGPINQAQRLIVNLPNRKQNDPAQSANDGPQPAAELSIGEINKAINNPEEFEKMIKEQQQLLASYNQPKQELDPSVSHFNVELQQHFLNHLMGLLQQTQQPQQPTGPPQQPRPAKPKVRPRWTGLGPFVPRGQPMGPPPSVRDTSLSEEAGPSGRAEPERAPISPPLMAGSSSHALAGPAPVISSLVPLKKRPIKALFQDFESKKNDQL